VVNARMCSDGARWRLKARDTGGWIEVRFESIRARGTGGIHFRYMEQHHHLYGHVFFRGTRVASDTGVLGSAYASDWGSRIPDGAIGRAVDRQTGEVCEAEAWYR
jgi:hypothetical protein